MIKDTQIPWIYIFNKVKKELLVVALISIAVQLSVGRWEHHLPEMPLAVPAFLGTAISVLLSFKMSQSYDRWWEARKVWGAIVNDSRSLILQLQGFTRGASIAITQVALRQIAWCHALGRALRQTDVLNGMERWLSKADIGHVKEHKNIPLGILQLQVNEIAQLRQRNCIDAFEHIQLDATLVRLCDAMGKAERINTTVFPVTYRLFLHWAIYLFVVLLSFALRKVDIIFEMPLQVVISCIFFLLEKTAFHLQDPFRNRPSDISVTAIATTIETNLKQLIDHKDLPPPPPSDKFYIL